MASITGYPKPNMTNLPRELGMQIFAEIQNSPKIDRKKMHEEAVKLEHAMKSARDKNE